MYVKVHVTVEDENDNAPRFDKTSYFGHIREDCQAGCPVAMDGPITAHDADTGVNAMFAMTLEGEDSHLFRLAPSGYVSLVGKLDREVKDIHVLRLVITDNGNYLTLIMS